MIAWGFCLFILLPGLQRVLTCFSFRFILPETLYIFWTCKTVSFPMLENFQLLSHQIFSPSPFSLFSSGKHIMRTLVCLILSQRSHRLSSTSFHSVFFIMFHKLTYPFFLPHLFYYWFLLVYFFISVIILFIFVCSLDLGPYLLSLLWILFWVDCLPPLHLVVLLGFYLVPLSGAYSPAILFCLTFCDCNFHSTSCRPVVILVSAVCSLVDEAGQRGLCKLSGGGDWFLPSGGWSWVLSLWWAGPCQGVFVGLINTDMSTLLHLGLVVVV